MNWVRTWEGGRVHKTKDGREIFYIRKRVGGIRKEIAVGDDHEDAKLELSRFNDDPAGYSPPKARAASKMTQRMGGGLYLDVETLAEFKQFYDEAASRGEVTQQHVDHKLTPYMGAWAKKLGPTRDLRTVTVGELKGILKKFDTARHARTVAIKSFTAWAREEKDFRRQDDPTLDLKLPTIVPAKNVKGKGYAMPLVARVYAHLPSQAVRDTIRLRAMLGMHDTEIDRIARGEGHLKRVSDPSGIEGVIVFDHMKKGKEHAVACDAETFAAAERLQALGRGVQRTPLKRIIDSVCSSLNIKPALQPGQLRHSFATWATTVGREVWPEKQEGIDLAKVSERIGHMGKGTTKYFYIGDHVPMMVWLPLKLEHPDDPVPMQRKEVKEQRG